MTRLQALEALLEKVEAGEMPVTWRAFDSDERIAMLLHNAFNGSIDAASALHDEVLPGWVYSDLLRRGKRYTATVAKSVGDVGIDGVSIILARAWLIAILKALIAEEGAQ